MRITIIHNPGSGEKVLTGPQLVAAAAATGHRVTYASTDDEPAVAERLQDPGDLVVVAGGDGTMRRVATKLIGQQVPITLIPAGTANNIGRTLGIAGHARNLIARWADGQASDFDIGIVSGSIGRCALIEGMGFGPIAVTIAALSPLTEAEASAELTDDEVRRDLKVLREIVVDYPAHRCNVTLDGRDLSGDYILAEVMNVRSVGPNVELAPEASVSDGLFDVVLLTDADRGALHEYLTGRLEGKRPTLRVPTHRGRHVRFEWFGGRVHVDDQVWPRENSGGDAGPSFDGRIDLEVVMCPAALQILLPAPDGQADGSDAQEDRAPAS